MSKIDQDGRFLDATLQGLMNKHTTLWKLQEDIRSNLKVTEETITFCTDPEQNAVDYQLDFTLGNEYIVTIYYTKCCAEGNIYTTEFAMSRG